LFPAASVGMYRRVRTWKLGAGHRCAGLRHVEVQKWNAIERGHVDIVYSR